MFKSKQYFSHWIREMEFHVPVSVYSCFVNDSIDPSVINVLNLVNEPEITRMKNSEVIQLADKFNLILTWDEELLEKLPNARLMFCGMTWIPEIYWGDNDKKLFKVSFICGSKNLSNNHVLRHHLWNRYYDIHANNVYFFNSSHNPMSIHYNYSVGPNPEDKTGVFKGFQYHIVVENVCQNNYFSEKIIDCFVTKTIPIYVGCKNIGNFFDERGIVQVNGVEEIISVCNNLNADHYKNNLNYIEKNFQLSKQYAKDFTERLRNKINEFLLHDNCM